MTGTSDVLRSAAFGTAAGAVVLGRSCCGLYYDGTSHGADSWVFLRFSARLFKSGTIDSGKTEAALRIGDIAHV